MPIKPYLQTAAAQLRRAAQERKRESDEMRAAIHQKEVKHSQYTNDLEKHMRYKRTEVRQAGDAAEQTLKAKEIQQLQQAKSAAEQHLNQEKQGHLDTISAKENDMQDLLHKAAELESRPAD